MNDRERIALHESGHAVAAVALGVPVRHVVILEQGASGGKCYFGSSGASAETLAIVYAAGGCAGRRADPSRPRALTADDVFVRELLRQPGDSEEVIDAVMALAEREAEKLVDRFWSAIQRAAVVLEREGFLEEVDITNY